MTHLSSYSGGGRRPSSRHAWQQGDPSAGKGFVTLEALTSITLHLFTEEQPSGFPSSSSTCPGWGRGPGGNTIGFLALTFYSLSTLSSLVISACLVTSRFILSPDLSSELQTPLSDCPLNISFGV